MFLSLEGVCVCVWIRDSGLFLPAVERRRDCANGVSVGIIMAHLVCRAFVANEGGEGGEGVRGECAEGVGGETTLLRKDESHSHPEGRSVESGWEGRAVFSAL